MALTPSGWLCWSDGKGIGGWGLEPILVNRVTHPLPLRGGDVSEFGADGKAGSEDWIIDYA